MLTENYWIISSNELEKTLRTVQKQRDDSWTIQHTQALQISKLSQELGGLRNELNTYKKPEPKFKVEQIVVSNYNGYESSFWIHDKKFVPPTYSNAPDGWHYTQHRQDSPDRRWVSESKLREQTAVEQGLAG